MASLSKSKPTPKPPSMQESNIISSPVQEEEDAQDDIIELFTEEGIAELVKTRSTKDVVKDHLKDKDNEIHRLIEIAIAIQQEAKRIESKIQELKFAPELLHTVGSVLVMIKEHEINLFRAEAKENIHLIICDLRDTLMKIGGVFKKIRLSGLPFPFGRTKLKKTILVLQQQLSDYSSILLATLCVEMAQHPTMFQQQEDELTGEQESVVVQAKLLEGHQHLYGTGKGGKQDVAAAIKAYTWAAEKGSSARAMLYLAHIYNGGRGLLPGDDPSSSTHSSAINHPFTAQLKVDLLQYRHWLEKAALFGSNPAMTELGLALIHEVTQEAEETEGEEEQEEEEAADDEEYERGTADQGGSGDTVLMFRTQQPRYGKDLLEEIRKILEALESQKDGRGPAMPRAASLKMKTLLQQRNSTMDEVGRATSTAFVAKTGAAEASPLQRSRSIGATTCTRCLSGSKKLKRGLALLLFAVEKEHASAQVALGNLYHTLSRDGDAFEVYYKAALQGHCRGQNMLGICHYKGIGVKKDDREAVKWFQLAIDQGNANACNNLGLLIEKASYAKSKMGNKKVTTSSHILNNSLNANESYIRDIALAALGGHYHPEDAKVLYRKGANRGSPHSMASLGYLLGKEAQQAASSSCTWSFKKAATATGCNHYENTINEKTKEKERAIDMLQEGIMWLRRSAEMGVLDSYYQLATIYDQGLLIPPDQVTAFYYYKKAADGSSTAKPHAKALRKMADFYYSGQGVTKDLDHAIYYYEKAAVAGDASAINNLGILIEQGKGMDKNLTRALRLYSRAASMGDANGAYNAGILLRRDKSEKGMLTRISEGGKDRVHPSYDLPPRDLDKALSYFEMADRLGHPNASDQIAKLSRKSTSSNNNGNDKSSHAPSKGRRRQKELSSGAIRTLNLTA